MPCENQIFIAREVYSIAKSTWTAKEGLRLPLSQRIGTSKDGRNKM